MKLSFKKCEDVVKNYKTCPKISIHKRVEKQLLGYYNILSDKIVLREPKRFFSKSHFWYVKFHELIHSTGNKKRINRKNFNFYGEDSKNIAKEEAVACLGGLLLCKKCGILSKKLENNILEYVYEYKTINKLTMKELRESKKEAIKAVKYILGE